ncbi:MAG: MaoC/PaaZ C-terminal domain-containing protein [Myxococcales bacterium]
MALNLGAVGVTVGPFEHPYRWKDVALYALAVGADTGDLAYLLDPAPRVLPTWGVVPGFVPVFAALDHIGGDRVQLLHSAQRIELLKPFPSEGVMLTTGHVLGIWDLRIGALVNIETRTQISGELHMRTVWTLLLRGEGGFESERAPSLLRTRVPKDRAPDFSTEWRTQETQALLYRLTGDINPIHSQPEVAKAAGFDRPILHGLCSYGFAGRVALKALAGDDPRRFRALEGRFTSPVLPGHTLRVDGYVLEPGKAALTVAVRETDELAIGHCLFEYEV